MNSDPIPCVAEILGVDGPVTFPELLLQKIWAGGAFNRRGLATTDGVPVEILATGRWNRLAGPDFLGARLRIGERELRGDVELHLRAEDWIAHGHAADPAFASVVLHVVLFPPPKESICLGWEGRPIPTLALLPWLPRDLESYALDDAAERLANRALFHAREELGLLSRDELRANLLAKARMRWKAKVAFAGLRRSRMTWAEACHIGALECLGYRFNRAPMVSIAERWPLAAWASGLVDAEAAWSAEKGRWKAPGRPSNHPLLRLRLYQRWARSVPSWPECLEALASEFPSAAGEGATRLERRRLGLSGLRKKLMENVVGGILTGSRFDTLVCDHWLPLLAAREDADRKWESLWFHWYAGDQPSQHARCLRELGLVDGRLQPVCNGWSQGLLGWCIEREARNQLGFESPRSDSFVVA